MSSSDSHQPQKSADLKFGQQRVYMKSRRGIKLAEEKLKNTAYTTLNEQNKKTIMDAIKQELKDNIIEDQKIMPAGALIDYEKLVDGVIRKVFNENLRLFKEDRAARAGRDVQAREDTPVLDELMDYRG
ncbi:hypothetical protein PG993_014961 [Apiospora rasikravindrae]|uniref:Uncharacterized protein n=1 Tax=Apiospora rasikravindrae TaxID=990691 RepID=A0ABR1RPG2_9PEZI